MPIGHPTHIPDRVALRALTAYTAYENGCHISTYSTASHGYAQIGWKGDDERMHGTTAHRAAWVAHTGQQIPEGYVIDHTCKNRRCVNPEHLRLLSNFENARRTSGRDWPLGECANGHPNSELRLWGGKRGCRLCRNEVQRRNRAKRQQKEIDMPNATTTERRVTCRYMRRNDQQCTGEVTDPNGDILLCAKHLARALALVQAGMRQTAGARR